MTLVPDRMSSLADGFLDIVRRIACGPDTATTPTRRHLASLNRRTLACAPCRLSPRPGRWPNLRELWYATRTSWLLAHAKWHMRRSLRYRERVDRLHAMERR